MKKPDEIYKIEPYNKENIAKVEAFLEKNYKGEPVRYEGSLTEKDIFYMRSFGWYVEQVNNKEGSRYWSYFLISA